MIYLLLALGSLSTAVLIRKIYNFSAKVTIPPVEDYLSLTKEILKTKDKTHDNSVKTKFMEFVVKVGNRSLSHNKGIGYFWLPHIGSVYVLSKPSVVRQFYETKNKSNFSQLRFFNRLSIILGPDNLMSSPLGSSIHSSVRKSIFNRNEKFIPHIADLVKDFFLEYSKQNRNMPIGEVMNALSRRVLLTTYFDKSVVDAFERNYDPKLTAALLSSIFELETITDQQKQELEQLRNKLFEFGCKLILLPEVKNQLFGENNWLNYLLNVRIERNTSLQAELSSLGILNSPQNLQGNDWEILLNHAIHNQVEPSLASVIRDVINESLFIPLLGFDATATMLLTSLRIAIQDSRINSIVKSELKQLQLNNYPLKIHHVGSSKLSYIEAVILEALRISPPAPVIPEIVTHTFSLDLDGEELELPQGALVFMPMEGLHTHEVNTPDIPLSIKGQTIFNKTHIDSKMILPERWKPMSPQGIPYNADLFDDEIPTQEAFFSFKTGARQCPGQRLALTEALGIFSLFNSYEFKLNNEEELNFPFSYDSPFQRNGGNGSLRVSPKPN